MAEPLFNSLRAALAILIVAPLCLSATSPPVTLEQKAGQFLGTTLAGLSRDDELDLWLRDRGVALLVFYRDDVQPTRNAEIRQVIARHARSGLEPLVAVDQEGGVVVRYDPAALPSPMALGASGSEELAWRGGRFVGCSLRALGIDINFAPVLDLSSPGGSGLGTRSFGRDPAAVGRLGAAFIKGVSAGGVLSIAKHFPGQGFADADPHFGLSKSSRTGSEMREEDLHPFRSAIAAGAAGVMTAHVTYPVWKEAGEAPASLSRPLLETILRAGLGFEGLVITDAIQMRGLGENQDAGELSVRAIEAGADVVLAPAPLERESAYRAILEAIRSGRLSNARVERTMERLRAARAKLQKSASACAPEASPAEDIARAAVTRIGGAAPLDPTTSFFIGGAGDLADRFPENRRNLLTIDPPATKGRCRLESRKWPNAARRAGSP